MRVEWFKWEGARPTAAKIRLWILDEEPDLDVDDAVEQIGEEVAEGGDEAVLRLTARFDATDSPPRGLQVDPNEARAALDTLDPALRSAMEVAAENVRAVALAQIDDDPRPVTLPQGQTVTIREVAVGSAGIYAPGGRAAYPSSVIMCAVPARVAGVDRIALASPPGPDGRLHPLVLAAAALCEIEEIYAMGGAQAIFALAIGTETITSVDVITGPGNAWVREAKRTVFGMTGIDSLAGPSELMLIAGHDVDPEWAALDLCAQAEHGPESPLVVAAAEEHVLDAILAATKRVAESRPGVGEALLGVVQVPDLDDAVKFANIFAPEHLELMVEDAALLAKQVTTAGCVFAGRYGATAFGDYLAGSNHVLPTAGAGYFTGPLGPAAFRRKIATVEIGAEAAAAMAPQVNALARAEGFPVHGESAMIRAMNPEEDTR
jgi:histidinol dehydrogenase